MPDETVQEDDGSPEPGAVESRLGELLTALEQGWWAAGARVAQHLAPGLSDGQIDETIEPLGLTLPVEARAWWRWHNGSTNPYASEPGPALVLYSLDDACRTYRMVRELADDSAAATGLPATDWWDPEWFPIVGTRHSAEIAVTCAVPAGAPTPIRVVEAPDEDRALVRLPSWSDVVTLWVHALNSGRWRWDGDGWYLDESIAPLNAHAAWLGLV